MSSETEIGGGAESTVKAVTETAESRDVGKPDTANNGKCGNISDLVNHTDDAEEQTTSIATEAHEEKTADLASVPDDTQVKISDTNQSQAVEESADPETQQDKSIDKPLSTSHNEEKRSESLNEANSRAISKNAVTYREESDNEYADDSVASDKHSVSSSESRSRLGSTVRSLSPNSMEASRRRMIACKRCHSLKVKCVPIDLSVEFSTCKRCFNKNVPCEYNTVNKKKKPAPLTNSMKFKIKDDEIKKLRDELQRKDRLIKLLRGFTDEEEEKMVAEISMNERLEMYGKEIRELETLSQNSSRSTQFIYNSERRVQLGESQMSSLDIIGNNILTYHQCAKLLDLFLNKIYPKFPFVTLPSNLSVEYLREHEPLLLVVMVYIGTIADTEPSDVSVESQLQLECLIAKSIAIQTLVVGNKNVNLLRCTMLYTIWYVSPELFHHRRYHLFSSLCVSMTHDLGVSGRPFFFYNKDDGLVKKTSVINGAQSIELKALVLVVYISYMSTSLFLKRVVFLQWTEYLDHSCSVLEESSVRSHKMIALYARMNHLMEIIYYKVHKMSEQITVLELSSNRNKLQLAEYLDQLNEIKQKISNNFKQNSTDYDSLMAYMYSVQAYLYEPALQTLINSKEYVTPEYKNVFFLTLSQICDSCFLSLKHFNQFSLDELTSNPLFHKYRILYTSGMLLRIRYLSLTIPKSGKASLFTEECVSTIKNLTEKLDETAKLYPKNHSLKKIGNVLGLFIHTCLSQWYTSYKNLYREIRKHDPLYVDPLFGSDPDSIDEHRGRDVANNSTETKTDKSLNTGAGYSANLNTSDVPTHNTNIRRHSAAFKPMISSLLQSHSDQNIDRANTNSSYRYGLDSGTGLQRQQQQEGGQAMYSVTPSPPIPVLQIASNAGSVLDANRTENSAMKFMPTSAYNNNMHFNPTPNNAGNIGNMAMEQTTGLDQLAGLAVGDITSATPAANALGRAGVEGAENNWEFQYMAFNDEFWSDLFFGNGDTAMGNNAGGNDALNIDSTSLNLPGHN